MVVVVVVVVTATITSESSLCLHCRLIYITDSRLVQVTVSSHTFHLPGVTDRTNSNNGTDHEAVNDSWWVCNQWTRRHCHGVISWRHDAWLSLTTTQHNTTTSFHNTTDKHASRHSSTLIHRHRGPWKYHVTAAVLYNQRACMANSNIHSQCGWAGHYDSHVGGLITMAAMWTGWLLLQSVS